MGSLGLTMNQDSQVILILRRVRLTYQGLGDPDNMQLQSEREARYKCGLGHWQLSGFFPTRDPESNRTSCELLPARTASSACLSRHSGDLPKPRRRLRSLPASPSHGHLSNASLISQVVSLIQRSLSQPLPSPSSPARARLLSSPSSSPDFAFMGNRRLSVGSGLELGSCIGSSMNQLQLSSPSRPLSSLRSLVSLNLKDSHAQYTFFQ